MRIPRHASSLIVLLALAMTGCDVAGRAESTQAETLSAIEVSPAELDRLDLPTDGASMDWNVGTAPKPLVGRNVGLGSVLKKDWRPWGVAVSRSGRAIMTFTNTRDRSDKNATRAALLDVVQGRIETAWKVPDHLAPFDIHPEGTTAILCRKDGYLSDRETLYVYHLPLDGPPTMEIWRPLIDPSEGKVRPYQEHAEIKWLKFVGRDRIVTLNNAGTIHVWDLSSRERLASIPDVVGTPCLTPDRNRVAFLTGETVALLDPAVPRVVAARHVGEIPECPLLTFRSDGARLATTGSGRTTVLDLQTGWRSHSDTNRLHTKLGMQLMPDLAWMGRYLYSGKSLYGFDVPISVWRFSGIEWAMPEGDRLWAVVRSRQSKQLVLRSFELPLGKIEHELRKIYRTSDVVPLRPGDPVQIDVSAIPTHRQDDVRADLADRLTEGGYQPSADAPVVLRASIDEPTQAKVMYAPGSGPIGWMFVKEPPEGTRTFHYHRQPARMELVKGRKVLWSAFESISPPSGLDEWPEQKFLHEYGGPDYELFARRRLPEFIQSFPGMQGTTDLFAEGMK